MTSFTRRRRLTIAAFAAVVVVVLVWLVSCSFTLVNSTEQLRDGEGGGTASAGARHGFGISGDASVPLRPGLSSPIDVVIDNEGGRAMEVFDLAVEIEAVDAPYATASLPCTVDDFAVTQMTDEIPVASDSTITLSELGWDESRWPQLRMVDTSMNQDGCVDATIELNYSAVARAAS